MKLKVAAIVVSMALVASGTANATLITYDIDVTVASDPNTPGSFASNPWSFGSLPGVFSGTFTADDTVAGLISNLNLIIGGLDIATSHPNVFVNSFDPGSLLLTYGALDTLASESFVGFGNLVGFGSPTNYAVAVQNSLSAPIDPFYSSTQNWVGTLGITPTNVPEPTTLDLFAVGLAGFGIRRRESAKKKNGVRSCNDASGLSRSAF